MVNIFVQVSLAAILVAVISADFVEFGYYGVGQPNEKKYYYSKWLQVYQFINNIVRSCLKTNCTLYFYIYIRIGMPLRENAYKMEWNYSNMIQKMKKFTYLL